MIKRVDIYLIGEKGERSLLGWGKSFSITNNKGGHTVIAWDSRELMIDESGVDGADWGNVAFISPSQSFMITRRRNRND